jgi:hypothetical protein
MSLDIEAGVVNNYQEKTTDFSNCVRNGGRRDAPATGRIQGLNEDSLTNDFFQSKSSDRNASKR